jgi:hypothetical protein
MSVLQNRGLRKQNEKKKKKSNRKTRKKSRTWNFLNKKKVVKTNVAEKADLNLFFEKKKVEPENAKRNEVKNLVCKICRALT